jgi:penicillin-binding protein 1A
MKSALRHFVGKSLLTVFVLIPVILLMEIPVFLAGAALGVYVHFSKELPRIPGLETYQPRTVSTFYADDGTVIGTFYKQRRFVVDPSQIPPHVTKAFLAAEDARFYEHSGVDWMAMARATWANIKAGRIVQGGGTIKMQVARNFLLTRDKTLSRKIKEMLLAPRIEKMWGKEKILYVYLNEIYLGEGSYGVEAAARSYFAKPVEHLSVAEAALIAGLVASPARYNPFKSEELARQRQLYVLGRMLRASFITQEEYEKAKQQKLVIKRDPTRPFDLVPDFAEEVRRQIIRKYGEEKLYNEGLKVFTTVRIDYQRHAQEALEKGIAEIKARQKHFAIVNTVPPDQIPEVLQGRTAPHWVEGRVYQGIVRKVNPKKTETDLEVSFTNRVKGRVRLEGVARAYKVGHVLALRFEKFVGETPEFTLDDNPQLQGALILIENRTGYVRALVGGISGQRFQFNRASQAKRQPGSAFKPIVYSVALEEKSYSPATIIIDDPVIFEIEVDKADQDWQPRNAGGDFLGPLSFRRALELSRNICTAKILSDVKLDPVIRMAKAMGIRSPLGRNLSLSLGTSEVSLMELASAYTVFPNSGVHLEPILIKRIEDRFGNVLEDNSDVPLLDASEVPHPVPREEIRSDQNISFGTDDFAYDEEESSADTESEVTEAPKPVLPDKAETPKIGGPKRTAFSQKRARAAMSPQTAYIMTNLLQGGVTHGTGARMSQYLKRRDLAGKTGTTNKSADAWFIGFNPDYTAGVWVGFDERRPLGPREEGGRAALPIWGYLMKEVLDKRPEKEFPVPPDITFKEMLTIDGSSKTGFVPKTVREPIYTPFVNRTLILSPEDTPEILASYRGVSLPGAPYAPGQQPAPTGGVPLHPLDGRNLFPDEAREVQPPALMQPNMVPGLPQSPPGAPPAPPREMYRPPVAPPAPQAQGAVQREAEESDQETVRPRSRSKYEPLFYQQRYMRQ